MTENGHTSTRPVAVVTGAAGELGSAIAARLLTNGYRVAAVDRTWDLATSVVERLGSPHVAGFAADQTDPDAIIQLAGEVTTQLGTPTVAVANAGYAKFGALLDIPAKAFQRHTDVNLVGTFLFCQAMARAMVAAEESGNLIVISSSLALAHSDQVVPYSATKAALLPLVRGLAAELGTYGIRANALLPGVVETGMTGGMLAQPGVREDLIADTPLGRLGVPTDIADAVAFLASQAAQWITGAAISVDGGQAMYGQPRWIRQDRSTPGHPRWVAGLGIPTNEGETTHA
jgi:NAD(P)-dependent dehydrogenase (short-subunit alcohol dehydrogenase family)